MPCDPCGKQKAEKRVSPPQYAPNISVKDRIFFLRILFRWSGSVWRMLWLDLLIFVLLYIVVNCIYHFVLSDGSHRIEKQNFEKFVQRVRQIASSVPLSFLLGFFVSAVLGRWWSICMTIPWMSQPSFILQSYIAPLNHKDLARKIRMNILRYLNLAWILSMRSQSLQIFRRFQLPGERKSDFQKIKLTMENLFINRITSTFDPSFKSRPVSDKDNMSKLKKRLQKINEDTHVKKNFGYLISRKEMDLFMNIADKSENPNYYGDFWIPLQWCTRILVKAKHAGLLMGEYQFSELIQMVDRVRGGLGTLSLYSDINIPLVYTQVIIIAVYSFFLAEIFSSQLIKAGPAGNNIVIATGNGTQQEEFNKFDNYIPVFSMFKFIFFMGWFKTAASLLNPLGNDSHDLPTSLMLDYNLMISVASGDADDDIYPQVLAYDGDPISQLNSLKEVPDKRIAMEAFELEEASQPKPSEERLIQEEVT